MSAVCTIRGLFRALLVIFSALPAWIASNEEAHAQSNGLGASQIGAVVQQLGAAPNPITTRPAPAQRADAVTTRPAPAQHADPKILSDAINTGQTSRVIELLQSGRYNVRSFTDDQGNSALHLVTQRCETAPQARLELIKFLIAHGANTEAKNRWGDTPAQIARIKCGDPTAVLALLTEGLRAAPSAKAAPAEATIAPPQPAVRAAPLTAAAPLVGRSPQRGNPVNIGQAPLAPPGIPEPLASSCRAEAQASYAERLRFYKDSPSVAAQWVQSDYQLIRAMDPRYLEYQGAGEAGNARTSPERPAQYLFRACLYGARLQMLGGTIAQWHPGLPLPSGPAPHAP